MLCYLQKKGFFYLANDPEVSVRKRVVSAFLLLVELHPTVLTNCYPKLIEFVLACMQQENQELAKQAAEFWTLIAALEGQCEKILNPFLPKILPVLLSRFGFFFGY